MKAQMKSHQGKKNRSPEKKRIKRRESYLSEEIKKGLCIPLKKCPKLISLEEEQCKRLKKEKRRSRKSESIISRKKQKGAKLIRQAISKTNLQNPLQL